MDWRLLVDYCDVFISCLDSHSDGTHSLQRIHWRACDVMLNFAKSVPTSTYQIAIGWLHFHQILIFGWTIPLSIYFRAKLSLSTGRFHNAVVLWNQHQLTLLRRAITVKQMASTASLNSHFWFNGCFSWEIFSFLLIVSEILVHFIFSQLIIAEIRHSYSRINYSHLNIMEKWNSTA